MPFLHGEQKDGIALVADEPQRAASGLEAAGQGGDAGGGVGDLERIDGGRDLSLDGGEALGGATRGRPPERPEDSGETGVDALEEARLLVRSGDGAGEPLVVAIGRALGEAQAAAVL